MARPKPLGPVVFRFDATPQLGMGHMQRCLVLIDGLRRRGAACHVVGRIRGARLPADVSYMEMPPSDDVSVLLEYAGNVGAKALVLDYYGVDEAYQQALHEADIPWLQFEGWPHQRLWAHWVLAASPAALAAQYRPLLQSGDTRLLLGPDFALLRSDFLAMSPRQSVNATVQNIVITIGGGSDRGAILRCVEALKPLCTGRRVQILTSAANPSVPDLNAWMAAYGQGWLEMHLDAPDFATRLAASDIAIIGGGTTSFETAFLGVPALIVQIADNQKILADAWSGLGVAENLGRLESLSVEQIRLSVARLIADDARRQRMAASGRATVDGRGGGRVVNELLREIGGDADDIA